uniref:Transforming acidic coiled-coil-containing protein C-terminal domain-containing protein n=1 Tax=Panagrolaimus superbus TaxID=310955 RepID=A0A914Y136_9BILA
MELLPTTDKTPKSVSFKVEEASAETSVFSTPPVVKYLHQTPTTDLHQKSVSFNVGKDVDDDHVVKPSYFATPKPVSKKQPLEYTDETYFEDEKSFEQEAVTTTSSEAITGESPKRSDASVFDASMVSFLEEEMQVYAEEQCKCIRFESVIKEYNILREKFEAKPGSGNVNTTITNDASVDSKIDEEIFQLNEELVKVQMEVEDYKKAAEIAKKEAEDFQFVLDEEKRRAKNRIADLQKENFALSDELETLKLGGGDASRKLMFL